LQYLAGGQAMDVALVHGVSHNEVFTSLWLVADAINQQPELSINFPESTLNNHNSPIILEVRVPQVLVIVLVLLMACLYV
jgi:hypothetical protein